MVPGTPRGALWEQTLEATFFGTYEHTLDGKGRLILPAKFRKEFTGDAEGYLSQSSDRCLNLWTPPEFRKRMQKMRLQANRGRAYRNVARVWAAGVAEIQVDAQGRVPIPAHLRSFAQLEGDVLVIGAYEKVEIWSPSVWRERVMPSERDLTEKVDIEGDQFFEMDQVLDADAVFDSDAPVERGHQGGGS
ncbi:MAG: division/cell wall cluster transcriptional repressor MraZ [Actinomycetota bacterium]|nr:division/cell wall cluster transcriptional repressor MraZ [Actinomycetota bacterium]